MYFIATTLIIAYKLLDKSRSTLKCLTVLFLFRTARTFNQVNPPRGVRSVGPVGRVGRFCSGLRSLRRTCLTILRRAWSAKFKMV
jgi:hypothetical protein